MEETFRSMGMICFILYGLSDLLTAILLIGLSSLLIATPAATFAALFIAMGALMAVFAMLIISLGPSFKTSKIRTGRVALCILLYAILMMLAGISALSVGAVLPGTLVITGSVLVILAVLLYVQPFSSAKIVGSIFGLTAVSLFIAGGMAAPAMPGQTGMISGLITGGVINQVALIIGCVAALFYPLVGEKRKTVSFFILLVAVIIFGIGTAVMGLGGLGMLAGLQWGMLPGGVAAILAALIGVLILIVISGFLILGTSALGFYIYGKKLIAGLTITPSLVCPKCGAPVKKEDKFCPSCGSRIPKRS